jgi:hypothetical protein
MADDNSSLAAVESLLGDRYTREARLAPAFLSLLPVLLLLLAWVGDVQKAIPGLLTLVCFFGVMHWIAQITRGIGDAREVALFRRWGGKPTTTMLRLHPAACKECTESEIRRFLPSPGQRAAIDKFYKSCFDDETLPDEHRERPCIDKDKKAREAGEDHPADALDRLYEPYVARLREITRDVPLVFEENISYGFQRNFYSLKWWAFGCGVVSLAIHLTSMWWHVRPVVSWRHIAWSAAPIAVAAALVAYLAGVLVFVTEESVKLQGFAYARQLINSVYALSKKEKGGKDKDTVNPG